MSPSQRVLATDTAKQAATKMQAMLSGDMSAQLRQLQVAGNDLSNPDTWDGPLAARFRTGEWPAQSRALQSAITTLDTLSKQMQTVVQNILHAGGGS
jgi:hypothetical protein